MRIEDPRGLAAAVRRHVVERIAAAGGVVVGKANCDEFAMGSLDRELGLRADPQPARPDPRARRLVAAAPRPPSPPASRRSRSAPTPAGRSASPPRCAASSA